MSSTSMSSSLATVGPPIPDDLIPMLNSWRRPAIVGHVRPDADCLGSMFAAALTWPGGDEVARVSLPDGSLSRRLAFMAEWVGAPVIEPAGFDDVDGFLVVDTAKKPRCNIDSSVGESWSDGRAIVNVDHHTSNTLFGAINWIDAEASSACELIYRLIRVAGRPISPLVASLLYSGIHSDTVGFSLPTTSSSSLHAAADLVDCGARVTEIGERLCRSQSKPEFDLNRVFYDNTRLVADGRISYSAASYDEITEAGCTFADIDDQAEIPRSLSGIQIAILFTEGRPGKTRLNLRGEGSVKVLELSRKLGGGGHAQAAGAILDAGIEESVQRVIPMAMELLGIQNG